ncbi:ATP-binding protein [Rummeliibacillus sp. G93]|uniref:AAA family ATPase n=1 Tax=Rummeliibacillus sp. G93 TaxID=2939494 RepID=UPI00201C1EC6|nr:ATP-binding protein [Rummeliibacillus sp. G93]UQW96625.1 ATP-binding protein [Rummeliibacillus sp. G93]
MISELKINNFKGLTKLNIQNFSRINLFGGKNNAGKTTILEALFLFYDRLNPNMLIRQYNWRGMNEIPLKTESLFAPIFNSFNLDKEIKIEITEKGKSPEKMLIKYINDFSKSTAIIQGNDNINNNFDDNFFSSSYLDIIFKNGKNPKQELKIMINQNGLSLNVENGRPSEKQARFLSAKNNTHPNENAILYGELDINGDTEVVLNFLRMIEPRLKSLTSITLSNNMSLLYGDIGVGKKIPINYMGDGIGRVLTILLSIISNKNGLVLIDEIDNGIHYTIIPKVWDIISEVAEKYNCQIFATTHSYECLASAIDGISPDRHDEFRYIRVENTEENNQIGKIFTYETLEVAISNGWEVR